MRILSFFVLFGWAVSGCKDPAANVTSATVESATGEKAAAPAGATPGEALASLAINPSNTKVEFVGAKVTRSHDGGFTDFAGMVELNDPIEKSQIDITIQTASLYADEEKLTKHLKSDDFFAVEKYPTATFRSTEIRKEGDGHVITGNLTLHGITKRISFPATITATDREVSATSEFSINRHDFAITYPGMPDDLIRDLVVLKLSLKLPRQS
ncbi:MAG: YceI family protein [Polyangiales bacterium]